MKLQLGLVLSMVIALFALASCSAKNPPAKKGDFVSDNFADCQRTYKHFYGRDLQRDQVRAVPASDVESFVKTVKWGGGTLPCEIAGAIGGRPGVGPDPSPIALEITAPMPKGITRMMFIPRDENSSCKPKRGGVLIDPVAECDEGQTIDCSGVIGGEGTDRSCMHTCVCHVVCGDGGDCSMCP